MEDLPKMEGQHAMRVDSGPGQRCPVCVGMCRLRAPWPTDLHGKGGALGCS